MLAPLAAIAAGIVVSRFVPFESRELLSGIAAFLILGAAFVLLMRSMVVHMRRIKPDPESDEEPMEPDDPPRA